MLRSTLFSEIAYIPSALQKRHLPSLDGLRCFSIFYVIVAHVNAYNPNIYNKTTDYIFGGGVFGVHYFFVISGFIITTLLLIEKINTGDISLKHFYYRRLLRIFPLTYLFLIALIILNILFDLDIKSPEFVKGFLFIKNIGAPAGWYTAHYWSLSVEEQYYLIFPFILYKGGVKIYLKVCFLFIVLYGGKNIYEHFSSVPDTIHNSLADVFLSNNFLSILLGSLTSIFLFKMDIVTSRLNNSLLTVIHILLFMLAFLTFRNPRFFGLTYLLSSCSIAASIFLLIKFPYGTIHNILNNKIIAYLGKLSFSLYIWQQIFTAHQPWAHAFKYGNSIVLNLIFLGVVAYLSYNYFETPFLRLKERFK